VSGWAGVDVGGPRKGFDVAVIDRRGLVALERVASPRDVARRLAVFAPRVVAVDSPRRAARHGESSRASWPSRSGTPAIASPASASRDHAARLRRPRRPASRVQVAVGKHSTTSNVASSA